MKNSTSKPLVRTRKNPANSNKANISLTVMTDLFIHNCKQKNIAPETVAGYFYAAKRFGEWYGKEAQKLILIK